jgi:hypothetical protein
MSKEKKKKKKKKKIFLIIAYQNGYVVSGYKWLAVSEAIITALLEHL